MKNDIESYPGNLMSARLMDYQFTVYFNSQLQNGRFTVRAGDRCQFVDVSLLQFMEDNDPTLVYFTLPEILSNPDILTEFIIDMKETLSEPIP